MSDDEKTDRDAVFHYEIRPGETFTFDQGNSSIVLTSSASANTAIAAYAALEPSAERDAAIRVQQRIGNMSLDELQRELALLADKDGLLSHFGNLDARVVSALIEQVVGEKKAKSEARWSFGKEIVIGLVLLAIGAVIGKII